MIVFALLLVRRVGLAVGAFLFAYFLLSLMDRSERDFGKQIGVASGAAIVAFFAPGIKVGSQRRETETP